MGVETFFVLRFLGLEGFFVLRFSILCRGYGKPGPRHDSRSIDPLSLRGVAGGGGGCGVRVGVQVCV